MAMDRQRPPIELFSEDCVNSLKRQKDDGWTNCHKYFGGKRNDAYLQIHNKGQSSQKKGDLVLRRTLKEVATNKLTPNWEGLFKVSEEVGQGALRLEHLDGRLVPPSRSMRDSQPMTVRVLRPVRGSRSMTIQGTITRERQSTNDCLRH
ncbi:hypothetical protein CR513_30498, partial [Mucuna pruriens]